MLYIVQLSVCEHGQSYSRVEEHNTVQSTSTFGLASQCRSVIRWLSWTGLPVWKCYKVVEVGWTPSVELL